MKPPVRILYVGNDIHTLLLLANAPDVDLVGVNYNPAFLSAPSYTPSDHIFKLIYALRTKERWRGLELALLRFHRLMGAYSGALRRKYSSYLSLICQRKIPLVDLDQISSTVQFLKNQRVDLMVVNYWFVLPAELILTPAYGALNVHPSRLPQYRGALPTLWSLKNNDTSSAVSYIILKPEVDTGDIIQQYEFPIDADDDALSVECKIESVLTKSLIQTITAYVSGGLAPTPQVKIGASKTARYYEYMAIRWDTESAREIVNKIKYFHQWPLDACHARYEDRLIAFNHAHLSHAPPSVLGTDPGDFLIHGCMLHIRTSNGAIQVSLPTGLCLRDAALLFIKRQGKFQNGTS